MYAHRGAFKMKKRQQGIAQQKYLYICLVEFKMCLIRIVFIYSSGVSWLVHFDPD